MAANVTTIAGATEKDIYLGNYSYANILASMDILRFKLATDGSNRIFYKNASGDLFKIAVEEVGAANHPAKRIPYTDANGVYMSSADLTWDSGLILGTLTASQIVETDASKKLVSAAKATAYNKAFGTGAGTVAEGNHLHTGLYQTVLTNPVTGTGTSGYVARFTDTSTIGNGVIQDNGTRVGVGGAPDATAALKVTGSTDELLKLSSTETDGSPYITFNQGTTSRSFITHNDTNDDLQLGSQYGRVSVWTGSIGSTSERMTIYADGTGKFNSRFGIGGEPDATAMLTVTGNAMITGLTASQIVETDANKNLISAAKATAYNKAFGTGAGNVAYGDHLHTGVYQTVLTNPVTGTGTSGYVARFTDTSTIGNGVIQDNGTRVGVGGAPDATAMLKVTGSTDELLKLSSTETDGSPYITFNQGTTSRSFITHNDTNDDLQLGSQYGRVSVWTGSIGSTSERMTIYGDGTGKFNSRFGIGGEPDATAMLKVTGALYVEGDVYSSPWTAASPTVTGWSTTGRTIDIRYKRIGKLVFVNYKITGTGNTAETTFTLPLQAASTMALATKVGAAGSADDGEFDKYPNAGILFPASATTAVVRLDTLWNNDTTGSTYGNGQGKWLCGQFWYEAA